MTGALSARRGERPARAAEGRGRTARGGDQSAQAQGRRADHGPGHSAGGREAAPYDAGDVRQVMVTLPGGSMRRVCRVRIFPRPAAGARGIGCGATAARCGTGRTHSAIDRVTSDLWLSAAVGAAALRRRAASQPQGRVPRATAQGLVGPSRYCDPAAASAGT